MLPFKFLKEKYFKLRRENINAQEITGSWLHRDDDAWIFFAFYKDGICEYLDDDDDMRSWHYSVKGNKLKLWGADKSKAVSLELRLNGENLIINGTEYKRSENVWRSTQS